MFYSGRVESVSSSFMRPLPLRFPRNCSVRWKASMAGPVRFIGTHGSAESPTVSRRAWRMVRRGTRAGPDESVQARPLRPGRHNSPGLTHDRCTGAPWAGNPQVDNAVKGVRLLYCY